MAVFGKKKETKKKAAPKAAAKSAPSRQTRQPRQPKPAAPQDIYTLFLGLSALLLISSAVALGIYFHWYQTLDAPNVVIPLNWAR